MEQDTALAEATVRSATKADLVARARGMREMLEAQRIEGEERGYYSQAVHEAFLDAGFYHMLTPKRYGGLELGVDAFAEVLVEIGRADPGAAWCLGLGLGHTLTFASYWPEQAQDEIFNNPLGYFRAPFRFVPEGTATKVDGGYVVNGTWTYCSGVQYASHFQGTARTEIDGRETQVVVVVPAGQYEILDDWGGDQILGMRASGSNGVRIDNVFVPDHWVVSMNWRPGDRQEIAPGAALHGNPMYCGRIRSFFLIELTTTIVGGAQGAIDAYGEVLRTKKTPPPKLAPRYLDPNHQRDFGMALMLADASKALLLTAAERYMTAAHDWATGGPAFDDELDMRLRGIVQQAGRLACEAIESVWRTSGSSSARKGNPIEHYFRDAAMWRQHQGTQHMNAAPGLAQAYFGILQPTSPL